MAVKPDRGPSFFELLTQLASKTVDASALLQRILDTQGDERREMRGKLHDVEHEADEINHQFIQKLNGSFITPFDRDDMQQLAYLLDDCVDLMDEAGDIIVLYKLERIPQPFYDLLGQQVEVLEKCSKLTVDAMPKIKKPRDLKAFWLELNILENQADQIYRKNLGNLFDEDLDPLMVIKLKDVIEILEKAADAFETLAHEVETIAVKES